MSFSLNALRAVALTALLATLVYAQGTPASGGTPPSKPATPGFPATGSFSGFPTTPGTFNGGFPLPGGGINSGGGIGPFVGGGMPGTFSGGTPATPGTFTGGKPPPPPPPPPFIRGGSSPTRPGELSASPLLLPTIDPKTPLKDLLPQAPVLGPIYTGDDLTEVPELRFEAAPDKALTGAQWQALKAHHVAAALHLNAKETDGYLKAMLKSRADLKGLPFAMGDSCRQKGFQAIAFKQQATLVKPLSPEQVSASFVSARTRLKGINRADKEKAEQSIQAHIAAVRQIGGGFDEKKHVSTARYFTSVPRVEATRELARIAVFSPSEEAREEAIEALSIRREADYTPILAEALKYPWPQVARNATAAIAKLGRKDMLPNLVAMLDQADPRAPYVEKVDGKKTLVARELVRVNHFHNCMLCHAPAQQDARSKDLFLAEMPIPNQPMSPSRGYGTIRPRSNLIVRVDVTYLRQDFSLVQAVKPDRFWPAQQRFDFLVRKRELTGEEADDLWKRVTPRRKGDLTPYQKAAHAALRELTGLKLEAKASAWRDAIK
jgi:hypothetical protein